MNSHTIKTLEFQQFIEQIKKLCVTFGGQSLIDQQKFFIEEDQLQLELDITDEFYNSHNSGYPLYLDKCADYEPLFERILKGDILEPEEAGDMKKFLQESEKISSYFTSYREKFDCFLRSFDIHHSFSDITAKISRTIDENNEVRDNASDELRSLRKRINAAQNQIFRVINQYFSQDKYSDILAGESYIIKNGKYLIPVKPNSKNRIKGIVQDYSSTGKTLFIETYEMIEANNELFELKAKEREEIYRILKEITLMISENLEKIRFFIRIHSILDFYNAKGKYSVINKYAKPEINREKTISLKEFYHPFLKEPVKNNVFFGNDQKTLIISGPNTGGKTVALKSIGLISLIFQWGMFIPADFGSSIPIFSKIFVDIGDEQSIEQSLSTFSSHLININSILREINQETLVIIDEIGTGTSPDEGEALSCAIIEQLKKSGCFSIISSHFQKVKLLADQDNGIKNSSMRFDPVNLKPLYILQMDIPGASFAFEIAQNLGFDPEVIRISKQYLKNKNNDDQILKLEGMIKNYQDKKMEEEKLNEELQNLILENNKLKEEYLKKKNEIKQELSSSIEKQLIELKKVVEKRIHTIKKYGYDKEVSKSISNDIQELSDKLSEEMKQENMESEKDTQIFEIGEAVYLKNLKKKGKIIDEKKGKYRVSFENIIFETTPEDLEKVDDNTKESLKTYHRVKTSKSVRMELDLRGMRVQEAEEKLDRYFDEIVFTNYEKVYIIHGKGEGKLLAFVHDYLSKHAFVKNYEFASMEEGGYGCTIAYLKL